MSAARGNRHRRVLAAKWSTYSPGGTARARAAADGVGCAEFHDRAAAQVRTPPPHTTSNGVVFAISAARTHAPSSNSCVQTGTTLSGSQEPAGEREGRDRGSRGRVPCSHHARMGVRHLPARGYTAGTEVRASRAGAGRAFRRRHGGAYCKPLPLTAWGNYAASPSRSAGGSARHVGC